MVDVLAIASRVAFVKGGRSDGLSDEFAFYLPFGGSTFSIQSGGSKPA
jgi:hypothetical protein